MKLIDFSYSSTFDGTAPLRALAAYQSDGQRKPLMVCMHSYGGDRRMMIPCLSGRAEKGMFALAPDMRGRGDSAGRRDDGGVEIADIYDAIQSAIGRFPNEIDPAQIHIAGWSGGGGSVFQAFVKMPDLFASAQAFYGIADYAFLAESSSEWMEQVAGHIGEKPAEAPVRYVARNAIHAAGNNRATPLHLFWDEEETICPPTMNRRFMRQATLLGMANVQAFESRHGDIGRWFHGAEVRGDLAEAVYEPAIVNRRFAAPPALRSGTLIVPGFVIAQHFTFFIGTGESNVVNLDYDIQEKSASFRLFDAQGPADARAWARFPCRGNGMRACINDGRWTELVCRDDDSANRYIYNIALKDLVRLEW